MIVPLKKSYPITTTTHIGFMVLNNNILYARTNNTLNEIDISDTDAITETPYVSLQNNISFEHHFSLYWECTYLSSV